MVSEYNEQEIMDNVNLNAVFRVLLLSKLLPVLIRNAPSLIINMDSMSDNDLPLIQIRERLQERHWRGLAVGGLSLLDTFGMRYNSSYPICCPQWCKKEYFSML